MEPRSTGASGLTCGARAAARAAPRGGVDDAAGSRADDERPEPVLEGGKWSGHTGPLILEGPSSSVHVYIVLCVGSGLLKLQ
jgi:hypothetical protein